MANNINSRELARLGFSMPAIQALARAVEVTGATTVTLNVGEVEQLLFALSRQPDTRALEQRIAELETRLLGQRQPSAPAAEPLPPARIPTQPPVEQIPAPNYQPAIDALRRRCDALEALIHART